jgi:transposase
VTRWEHQDVLEQMQARLEHTPDAMRIRRCTVEHPYGTIKAWMGATHFLTKGLEHVKTEMSLHVLAYNFKRLIAILGIADMMKAIRAFIRLRRLGNGDAGDLQVNSDEKAEEEYSPATRFLDVPN